MITAPRGQSTEEWFNRLLNTPIQRLFGYDFAKVRHTQLA